MAEKKSTKSTKSTKAKKKDEKPAARTPATNGEQKKIRRTYVVNATFNEYRKGDRLSLDPEKAADYVSQGMFTEVK